MSARTDRVRDAQLDGIAEWVLARRGAVIAGPMMFAHKPGACESGPDMLAHVGGRWRALFVAMPGASTMSVHMRKSAANWDRFSRIDAPALFVFVPAPGQIMCSVPIAERDELDAPAPVEVFFR